MQEAVDAILLEKVKTSIERNKSLQMLAITIGHNGLLEAILKGAHGNTSLKRLGVQLPLFEEHVMAAAAELRQVRPQLELHVQVVPQSTFLESVF